MATCQELGMWVSLFRRRYMVPVCGLFVVATSGTAAADPFSATFTSRESKRITAIAPAAPYTRTYQALTEDSKDLTFQESLTGRTALAFASKDGALDDLGTNQCSTTGNYSIYWADKYQNLPAECLTFSYLGGDSDNDSEKPKIGGFGRDLGRYIAYETDSKDIVLYAPTPLPTSTPTVTPTFTGSPVAAPDTPTPLPTSTPRVAPHQVVVHDRKWGVNFPSGSKCDVENNVVMGANKNLYLWEMSEDGKNLLLSTRASNMTDNLSPSCTDSGPAADVFIRDGSDCLANTAGACMTSVLYDRFGYHIDPAAKETLDEDSQNLRMTEDKRVVVFDTASTNPMYFSPDIRGFKDIYYHTNESFARITEAMVPFCDSLGNVVPLTNEYGPADGDSEKPDVDDTGRYVVFESLATDLVVWEENPAMTCVTPGAPHPADIQYLQTNGRRQIYLYDHLNRKIELISKKYRSNPATRAQGGNGDSTNARISKDGRFILFESRATDLMGTTTTGVKNIFMYDRYLEETYLVTTGLTGAGLNKDSSITHVSPSGLTVAFQTKATNVVIEGPEQGSTVGGTVSLCGGGTETCAQHVYLARNSCPLDTDGDLAPDCLDACKTDRNKTEPQLCGCGVSETDTDNDFAPDCIDACDTDPNKSTAGQCGCGKAETDSDADGAPDCVDKCPSDTTKNGPGICGCGIPDLDTDSDGSYDCNDSCPSDPNKKGIGGCACGTLKDTPGVCGCNVLDTDNNGNGQADCLDPSSATVPATPSYDVSKIGLGRNGTLTILRIKMQGFGGKVTYSYSLTRKGYKLQKTGSSNTIAVRGVKSGTYTFSYSISTGSGAGKTTTRVSTSTIRVN